MNCLSCKKPVVPQNRYCPRCRAIMRRAHAEFIAHRKALSSSWSEAADGFLCRYSGLRVEERDQSSPWYISFDHPTPGKKGILYVTTKLFNSMKKDLTDKEFLAAVLELDRKFGGGVFRKDALEFRYWIRAPKPPTRPGGPGAGAGGSGPATTARAPGAASACVICASPAPAKGKYCPRCNGFILHHSDKAARARALAAARDPVRKGFACYYTGVLLEEADFHDPWYLTFDHPDPDDKGRLVVAAAWVNGMKADLGEADFRAVVKELARHFRTGEPFDRNVAAFKHWFRKMRKSRLK